MILDRLAVRKQYQMRLITVAMLAVLLISSCANDAKSDVTITRSQEASEILTTLVTTHPRGREIAALPEFQSLSADLIRTADQIKLSSYVEKTRKLFSLFEDGHTAVLGQELTEGAYGVRLPIRVDPFEDGMYVIEAKGEALPLIGSKITKIAGASIEDILMRYLESSNGDNPAFKMRWSIYLFSSPALLQGMGFLVGDDDAPIEIEAIGPAGETVRVSVKPHASGNLNRIPLERQLSKIEELAYTQPSFGVAHFPLFLQRMNEGRALYVSLAEMGDQEGVSFLSFTVSIENAMKDPHLDRVIIDLRQNGGGNNMLSEPFRRALVRSRFNAPGGLYVLTSRKTFSAAMNFATRLERETDAIFVGEPTGGRPNHFGDAKYIEAPVTGLPYLVSTIPWFDSTPYDERIWILPDIPAAVTFDDYLSGRDKALEAALGDTPDEATFNDDRISTPWERQSQLAGWEFFFTRR